MGLENASAGSTQYAKEPGGTGGPLEGTLTVCWRGHQFCFWDGMGGGGLHQMEGQVADLIRRIPILKRLIADCDRLAADLDQEVRNEEDRVKIHDPAHSAYSTYARATALRRHNLRRSADELRAHLAKAEKALREFGEVT
jgi:hypothetical protein